MYIKWQGKKKKKTKTERIRRHVLPKLSHSYFGDLHLEEGVCRDPLAFHSFVWLCFEIQVAMDWIMFLLTPTPFICALQPSVVNTPLNMVFGEGNGTPLQYSCLENPMDGGAWWAAVHGVPKSQTRLSDFTLTFHFHALEKKMATHSSVLAWRIPGTAEPGGLPSMGSYRVRHDWSDLAANMVLFKMGPWESNYI